MDPRQLSSEIQAGQLVHTAVFLGISYFLFTHGYKKSAFTLGAFGLFGPLLVTVGGIAYLKQQGLLGAPALPTITGYA